MANLKLWLAGAEVPPADVFLKVVDLVFDHDLPRGPADDPGSGKLQVRVGANAARCPGCDGMDFLVTAPGAAVNSLTVLKCGYCGREATRGDLVVRAADEVAKRGAAGVKRLMMQQAALKRPASDAPRSDPVEEPKNED